MGETSCSHTRTSFTSGATSTYQKVLRVTRKTTVKSWVSKGVTPPPRTEFVRNPSMLSRHRLHKLDAAALSTVNLDTTCFPPAGRCSILRFVMYIMYLYNVLARQKRALRALRFQSSKERNCIVQTSRQTDRSCTITIFQSISRLYIILRSVIPSVDSIQSDKCH